MKIKRSRPYYPLSKGKVERLIRNINEEYFRLYENINGQTLQEFILWYNTARIHDGIGATPVERYLGFRVEYNERGARLLELISKAVAYPSRKNLQALASFHEKIACIECGGETIRYGYRKAFGLRFQCYQCKSCGATFSLWGLVLRAVRRRYPECPRCGTNVLVVGWGHDEEEKRWRCKNCGHVFKADVKWLHKLWWTT